MLDWCIPINSSPELNVRDRVIQYKTGLLDVILCIRSWLHEQFHITVQYLDSHARDY